MKLIVQRIFLSPNCYLPFLWLYAASIFSEQGRLEPMSAERKGRWQREIDWLLSVADHIVEFVPSKGGSNDVEARRLLPFFLAFFCFSNSALKLVLYSFADNGDSTTQRSPDEHPCTAQTRRNARRKNSSSLQTSNKNRLWQQLFVCATTVCSFQSFVHGLPGFS